MKQGGSTRGMARWLAAACIALLQCAALAPAVAADVLNVGVIRLSSAGPVVIAAEKGYFKAQGLDVQIKVFEAASQLPVAVVSGDLDVGVTGLTAAFYNLAGRDGVKIIAGQVREDPRYRLTAIMVTDKAYAAGFHSIADMPGKRIGITTTGSTFHYMMGLLAQKHGFDLSSVTLVPLQSLPNAMAAFTGAQVDGALFPISNAQKLTGAKTGRIIGWVGDEAAWQVGAVFASPKTLQQRREPIERFLRGYEQGVKAYNAAFNTKDASGNIVKGAEYKELLGMLANWLGLPPEQVDAVPYVDTQVDEKDIARQVQFWQANNLVPKTVDARSVVDASFLQGATPAKR